jgi:hypothetical protein
VLEADVVIAVMRSPRGVFAELLLGVTQLESGQVTVLAFRMTATVAPFLLRARDSFDSGRRDCATGSRSAWGEQRASVPRNRGCSRRRAAI